MRTLFDPISLAVSGLPIGLLVALLRGAPFGALEFGATAVLAGAIAGAPAGFLLCRYRRWPSTWPLKLVVLMPTASAAMLGAFVVGAWMPVYTWEPLPATPSRATSLAGPECYPLGEAAVYAHTATGEIYRLALPARGLMPETALTPNS